MSRQIDSSYVLEPGIYVVATPIGNREDLSPRASRILREATIIACEDTRTSRKLEPVASSGARLVSLTEHNVDQRKTELLTAAKTGVVALVSDAGTPAIADPGSRLVAAAHEEEVRVFAVPGPSALAAALSVSGAGAGPAAFLGFLPRAVGERAALLSSLHRGGVETLVFFEAPGRVERTLSEIATQFSNPRVVICRELTKLHEEVLSAPAAEVFARLGDSRGEFAIVVDIGPPPAPDVSDAAAAYMAEMRRAGARRGQAASEASRRFGVSRSIAYDLWGGADDENGEDGDET